MIRRNWWLPLLGVLATFGGYGLIVLDGSQRVHPGLATLAGVVAMFVGPVLAIASALRNSFPLSKAATLAWSSDAFAIDDRELRVADVSEAKLLHRAGDGVDTMLVLAMRTGEQISLWMRRDEALALLGWWGIGAGDVRASFRLEARFRTRWMIAFVLAVPGAAMMFDERPFSFGRLVAGVIVCAVLATVVAPALGLIRGRLRIGADGFAMRWLGRERYVRFADVTGVARRGAFRWTSVVDTLVHLGGGRTIPLRSPEQPDRDVDRGAEGRALYDHLDAAYGRFRARDGVELRTLLERAGRSDEAWLTDLDALLRGGGARYRVATIEPDQIAAVVRDPLSPPEARMGAAAALVRFDPAYRRIVQRAADGCAEAELQASLAALSEAEDDEAVRMAFRKRGNARR